MRRLTLMALVAMAGTGSSILAVASPVQWAGNGHFYEAISVPAGIGWRVAYDSCQARGGYLATLTSAEEHAFVYGLVSGRPELWFIDGSGNGLGPWLGGFQPPGSGEPGAGWRWVSDEPWAYAAWSPGEPNNFGGVEDRTNFFRSGALIGDRWNDMPGGSDLRGYVLEIPTPARECTTLALDGHTYRLVRTPNRISWSDARDQAIAMGGHLATISSADENAVVASLATPDPTLWCIDPAGNGQGPWIGGYQPTGSPEPAGGWTWVTGEGLGFTAWAPFEPNNLNGVEHFLQLFARGSLTGSQWNDMSDFTPYGGLGFIVEFDLGAGCGTTSVDESVPPPFRLMPARPNPTRASASLEFELVSAAPVSAVVLDASGRSIRRITQPARFQAGAHRLTWDGRDERGVAVPNGVYLLRLTVGGLTSARRIVIVR